MYLFGFSKVTCLISRLGIPCLANCFSSCLHILVEGFTPHIYTPHLTKTKKSTARGRAFCIQTLLHTCSGPYVLIKMNYFSIILYYFYSAELPSATLSNQLSPSSVLHFKIKHFFHNAAFYAIDTSYFID